MNSSIWVRWATIVGACILVLCVGSCADQLSPSDAGPAIPGETETTGGASVTLPEPDREGTLSVEAALAARRSVRDYADEPLPIDAAGQLLWAAQGITDRRGFRTAPSAGALYPLELYLVAGHVTGLPPAVYHYDVETHALKPIRDGDLRESLAAEALEQSWMAQAPVAVVFAAEFERTTDKYGPRGRQYVFIEVGHAAQNLYLQAEGLGLGAVAVGAFNPDGVRDALGIPSELVPLYLMPVGYPTE